MATSKILSAGSVTVAESSGSFIINTPVVNIYVNGSLDQLATALVALRRMEAAIMTMKDSLGKLSDTEAKLEADFDEEEAREATAEGASAAQITALTAQRDDLQTKLNAAEAANDPAAVDAIEAKLEALDAKILAASGGPGAGSGVLAPVVPAPVPPPDTSAQGVGSPVPDTSASGDTSTSTAGTSPSAAPVEPLATEPATPAGIEPEVGSPIAQGETSLGPMPEEPQ